MQNENDDRAAVKNDPTIQTPKKDSDANSIQKNVMQVGHGNVMNIEDKVASLDERILKPLHSVKLRTQYTCMTLSRGHFGCGAGFVFWIAIF